MSAVKWEGNVLKTKSWHSNLFCPLNSERTFGNVQAAFAAPASKLFSDKARKSVRWLYRGHSERPEKFFKLPYKRQEIVRRMVKGKPAHPKRPSNKVFQNRKENHYDHLLQPYPHYGREIMPELACQLNMPEERILDVLKSLTTRITCKSGRRATMRSVWSWGRDKPCRTAHDPSARKSA